MHRREESAHPRVIKTVFQPARAREGFPCTRLHHPHVAGHTRGVRDIAVAAVAMADVPSGGGEEGPACRAAAGVGHSRGGAGGGNGSSGGGGGNGRGVGIRAAGGSTVLLASVGWDNRLIVWDLQVGGRGHQRREEGLGAWLRGSAGLTPVLDAQS